MVVRLVGTNDEEGRAILAEAKMADGRDAGRGGAEGRRGGAWRKTHGRRGPHEHPG